MREARAVEWSNPARVRFAWVSDLLLILILLAGLYLRATGLNWDQNQHLHPDERFLTMVTSSITLPGKDQAAFGPLPTVQTQPWRAAYQPDLPDCTQWGGYFDTACSPLNPHNRGYTFYVYGDLPVFITRFVGELAGKAGYDEIYMVGRQLSVLADLGTVLVVYLIAARLFRRRGLALLAAAFASFSVLPIQLAHYYTVETFTNFFGFLAFYFAARLIPRHGEDGDTFSTSPVEAEEAAHAPASVYAESLKHWRTVIPYVLFGIALGMAVASKVNAAVLAGLLPAAVLIRWLALPKSERERWAVVYLRNLAIAAVVSLVIFRICQPYAFVGPGFFGFKPNPAWISNIREQRLQAAGDVDFPPALQWARRPHTFGFENLTVWGLGLPLGILAWAGFLWMGWRLVRGFIRSLHNPQNEWGAFVLPWAWTGLYFAWQSLSWNPTMRYFVLIYPSLAIIAAWAVYAVWDKGQNLRSGGQMRINVLRATAVFTGIAVLGLTAAWAFAFSRIYTRPVTRVAASSWIYQNVPGPVNLEIKNASGTINQPLALSNSFTLRSGDPPLVMAFRPRASGELLQLSFAHLGMQGTDDTLKRVEFALSDNPDGNNPLGTADLVDSFQPGGDDPRGRSYLVTISPPVSLEAQKAYYLSISLPGAQQSLSLASTIQATIIRNDGTTNQVLPEPVGALRSGEIKQVSFIPVQGGQVREIRLDHVVDWEARPEIKTLQLSLVDLENNAVLGTADVQSAFAPGTDIRGDSAVFSFAQPVELRAQHTYQLVVEHVDGPGALAIYGSRQAIESSWDDALPLSLDGYNPYDYNQGIYRSDLNFEMYWDDNTEKLDRFQSILDQADYIFISSNRQWGTTVRVPERYPLTTEYYRRLIGCPPEKEITWCYSVAEPGMFHGDLGFELAEVVQSDPNLGSLKFNDQFAEEAFTVYDHPKVLIFRKTAAYNPDNVQAILGVVDLTKVIHLTPRKASEYAGNLLLPLGRWIQDQASGTWSQLFNTDALQNRYPGLGAVLWYLVIALLGWVCYPFTRLALRGLPDRGYPLARLVGLLLLAYGVWLPSSFGVAFTRLEITAVFAGLLLVNLVIAFFTRDELREDLRERWRYLLVVEGVFLAFFLLFLFVRLGNPDLWHPWKGGEKPMDFSYFNAVLKSTTFPPYDPWFAGGYINYYYYGFVIVGVPVKWLGIVPAIAYNLILPTLFAMLAAGGFSLGWNLLSATRKREDGPMFGEPSLPGGPLFAGIASALGIAVLGNWGTVRMVWQGLQRLADMQVAFDQADIFTRIAWTFQGLGRFIQGTPLPYAPSDWYWIPSRVSPGEPITEFPAFTFLYADMHAHMIALPITVLVLAWGLSMLLGRGNGRKWGGLLAAFFLGGLATGALRATNTWDWPTYLALAVVAVIYAGLRYGEYSLLGIPAIRDARVRRGLAAVLGAGLLVALSVALYQPFAAWYGSAYNNIDPWKGPHSPFWSYMTHWGVFLFMIVSWMAWETIDWMATTPLSALNRLRPYRSLIMGALAALVVAVGGLLFLKVGIAWLVLPVAAWAGVLLLRPGMADAKRAVLFMTGTGLVLTLFVELFVLRGDLGRMNTVFKFYLQAWTLLSLSAGASVAWLLPLVENAWRPGWRNGWEITAAVLVAGALLFPFMAGIDKINDRMSSTAPHTLDGMKYMETSQQVENGVTLDLSEDYNAIRWMQANVQGSPVIVEAKQGEYHWGTRFTIYTGLPGVVGWNWHQRQQRAVTPPEWVTDRIDEINAFYSSSDRAYVRDFLARYGVKYIIVGQLEEALYPPGALLKFTDWEGDLWHAVYKQGRTTIYEVNDLNPAGVSQK
jgi:YYY domain-containing protein